MKRLVRLFTAAGLLALGLLAAPPTPAQATDVESKENVRITVRVIRLEDGKPIPVKNYSLIVASGPGGSKLLAGERVPFVSTEQASDGGPVRSYVYQNIGFATEVQAFILDKKRIRVHANIEDSRVKESEGDAPPVVETRQLTINAILEDGQPLELTRVEGLEGVMERPGYVEIEAEILK